MAFHRDYQRSLSYRRQRAIGIYVGREAEIAFSRTLYGRITLNNDMALPTGGVQDYASFLNITPASWTLYSAETNAATCASFNGDSGTSYRQTWTGTLRDFEAYAAVAQTRDAETDECTWTEFTASFYGPESGGPLSYPEPPAMDWTTAAGGENNFRIDLSLLDVTGWTNATSNSQTGPSVAIEHVDRISGRLRGVHNYNAAGTNTVTISPDDPENYTEEGGDQISDAWTWEWCIVPAAASNSSTPSASQPSGSSAPAAPAYSAMRFQWQGGYGHGPYDATLAADDPAATGTDRTWTENT